MSINRNGEKLILSSCRQPWKIQNAQLTVNASTPLRPSPLKQLLEGKTEGVRNVFTFLRPRERLARELAHRVSNLCSVAYY